MATVSENEAYAVQEFYDVLETSPLALPTRLATGLMSREPGPVASLHCRGSGLSRGLL